MKNRVSEARTQIYLAREQMDALKRAAREQGVSVASYVREAVEEHLRYGCRRERRLTPASAINKLVGLFAGDSAPVAREHDRYLTDELRWRKARSS